MPPGQAAQVPRPFRKVSLDWKDLAFRVALPLLAMLVAPLIGAVLLLFFKADPLQAYAALVQAAMGGVSRLTQSLVKATPLLLVGLGVCMAAGQAYIPEKRRRDGAIQDFSVQENLLLHEHLPPAYFQGILMNFGKMAAHARTLVQEYSVKTPQLNTPVKTWSGGNIQKLIMARGLSRRPAVIPAAPRRRDGDIGAMEYIHERLPKQRKAGAAILLISEELDKVRILADRIAVKYEGRVIGSIERNQAGVEQIGLMKAGISMDEAIRRPA